MLHHELVDRPLDSLNEARELLILIRGDTSGDDGPGDTASPAEGSLGGDEDVRDVLLDKVSTMRQQIVKEHTFSSQSRGR